MDQQRDIDLIDNLRKQPAETPWLEFKANYHEPEKIGQWYRHCQTARGLKIMLLKPRPSSVKLWIGD